MNNIIVSDASPLIAFGGIHRLDILPALFGTVLIPEIIAQECLADKTKTGAAAIEKAIQKKLIQIHTDIIYRSIDLRDILDEGEAAAISLAHTMQQPLLIDEKLGRGVAKNLGIKIIGTIGVLLLAKQKMIVREIKPILIQLKNGHYFLSEQLIQEALIRAEETELKHSHEK